MELEALKREGTETEQDRLFAQKVATGCFDKHSTLRKVFNFKLKFLINFL